MMLTSSYPSLLVYKTIPYTGFIKHNLLHLRLMLLSLMDFQIGVILTTLIVGSINSVTGQVNTFCTTSMMSSFTPCTNIITGSTNYNGSKPPSRCCDSMRSLMSTNVNCAYFLFSTNAPFFQLTLHHCPLIFTSMQH